MDLLELRNKQNGNRHPWEYAIFNVLKHFLKTMIGSKTNTVTIDIGFGDIINILLKYYLKLSNYIIIPCSSNHLLHKKTV